MPSLRDQAICIRHWDWSETSQTVSLFTRESGVIRGIAKGAKRERAPFSGGIELLTRGEVVAIAKPGADLATLTAWDLQETFPAIRTSLRSFHCAMYMADSVQHAIHDHAPHAALFDALLSGLRSLGAAPDMAIVLSHLWATLIETGWSPELTRDVVSGEPLAGAPTYGFAPSLGGFTGERSPLPAEVSPGPVWGVRSETLEILRGLAAGRQPGDSGPEAIARAAKLLNAHLSFVLGRELATARAIFDAVP